MANPLNSFINITDQYGTQVSQYKLNLTTSLLAPQTTGYAMFTEFFMGVFVVVSTWGLWLLDVVVRQQIFLGIFAKVYQSVLDTVYHFVNPLIIGMFAFALVVLRIFIGDRRALKGPPGSPKVMKFRLEEGSLFDGDSTFAKRAFEQLQSAFLLLMVIVALMANPFLVLGWMMRLVSSVAGWIVGGLSGSGQQSGSTIVDGVLAPMLQLVNYGEILSPQCSREWSQALAAGSDVSELSCLSDAQRSAAEASWISVAVSVAAMVVLAGLTWFAVRVFLKASWYGVLMTWYVVKVPWQAALLLADPGPERVKLDKLGAQFKHAFQSLGWLLGIVFVAMLVPPLGVVVTGAAIDAGVPVFFAILGLAAVYGAVGWWIGKYYGKKFQRDESKWWGHGLKVRIDAEAPPTSWTEFRHAAQQGWAGQTGRKLRDSYQELMADARGQSTSPGEESETGEEAPVKLTQEDVETITAATDVIDSPVNVSSLEQAVVAVVPSRLPVPVPEVTRLPVPVADGVSPNGVPPTLDGLGPGSATVAVEPPRPVLVAIPGTPGTPGAPGRAGVAVARAMVMVMPAAAGVAAERVVEGSLVAPALPAAQSSTEAAGVAPREVPGVPTVAPGGSGRHAAPEGFTDDVAWTRSLLSTSRGPIDSAEQLAEQYRQQVRVQQEAADGGVGEALADAVIAGDGGADVVVDDVAAAALRRHAQASLSAADADDGGVDLGGGGDTRVVGGLGADGGPGFLGADAMTAQFRQTAILAEMLGLRVSPVVIDGDAGQEVLFDGVTSHGDPDLRFGDRRGFGDDI